MPQRLQQVSRSCAAAEKTASTRASGALTAGGPVTKNALWLR